MTNKIVGLVALLAASVWAFAAPASETIQPFVLAYSKAVPMDAEIDRVRTALEAQQFRVLGEYSPFQGAHVIAVTDDALTAAAAASANGGFGAAVHVALTQVGDKLQVSYMNPPYMAAAYRMAELPETVAARLTSALGAAQPYGTAAGRSPEDLRKFHYMVGMEYFTDPYQLAEYDSHAEAVKAVQENLAKGVGGTAQVYKLEIPGSDQVLFGVSRAKVGDQRANDKHILADTVDKDFDLKTTAYLPYQVLVAGDRVLALHMRFRMAVYHPDLTMGTFGKLMASPGAIEELLREVAGGKRRSKFTF